MFGASAVKHIPMDENINPPRSATARVRKKNGLRSKLKAAKTAKTIAELIKLLVAPQSSSPAITSSMLTGVVIIASKVF